MKPRILLLDRDGTLIEEPQDNYQVDSLEKLAFLPGVIRHLYQILSQTNFIPVMITNQDGLGTDSFPEDTFWPAHEKMLAIFEREGIQFHEVHIDRTFKRDGAPTRKPGTALLTAYMEGDYDLSESIVIGDRPSDIQLAKNLGAKGILLGRSTDQLDDEWDLVELADTLLLEARHWEEISEFILSSSNSRKAVEIRDTKETEIKVEVNLDGLGRYDIETGIGFFDHMLDQLSKHSGIDMSIRVDGDLHVDEHHTIEDTALALGKAVKEALGDKKGIERYGCFSLPMDDSIARVALDFSGRPWLVYEAAFTRERVGGMPVEMVEHFFKSFSDAAQCNLNIQVEGDNAHHMIEAMFKGVAKAIRMAIAYKPGDTSLPSTKGVL